MRKSYLKKIIASMLSITIALCVAACGVSGGNSNNKEVLEAVKEADDDTSEAKKESRISRSDKKNLETIKQQIDGMLTINTGLLTLIENCYGDVTNPTATVSDIANYAYEYLDEIEATFQLIDGLSTNSEQEDFLNTYQAAKDYFVQIYNTYYDLYWVGLTNYEVITALENGNTDSVGNDMEVVQDQYNLKYTMVEDLAQIEYPDFMELPMTLLVENYSNYLYAYEELYKGYVLSDPLRKQSAINTLNALQSRVSDAARQFDSDVQMQCVGMYNRISGRLELLASEILDAADKLKKGKQIRPYTYQNESLAPEIQCEYVTAIFPALYNSIDYVISMSAICEQGDCDILVETEIEGFTQKYSQKITLGPEITRLYIKPALLSQELNLNSQKTTQLKITVTNLENQKIVIQETKAITLMSLYDLSLSYGSDGAHPLVNTLAWLTPEAKEVRELKRLAIEEIKGLTQEQYYGVQTDDGIENVAIMTGIVGYQPANLNLFDLQAYYVQMQALAIQCAMSDWGIAYNMSSYSSSDFYQVLQRVVPPAETINTKSGVCIETSLVMASALQSAGMHCMLVFPPGHCQVAVEIWETGEYLLIETTILPVTLDNITNIVQYQTKEEWEQFVGNATYIIDCNMAPYLNLTPIYN